MGRRRRSDVRKKWPLVLGVSISMALFGGYAIHAYNKAGKLKPCARATYKSDLLTNSWHDDLVHYLPKYKLLKDFADQTGVPGWVVYSAMFAPFPDDKDVFSYGEYRNANEALIGLPATEPEGSAKLDSLVDHVVDIGNRIKLNWDRFRPMRMFDCYTDNDAAAPKIAMIIVDENWRYLIAFREGQKETVYYHRLIDMDQQNNDVVTYKLEDENGKVLTSIHYIDQHISGCTRPEAEAFVSFNGVMGNGVMGLCLYNDGFSTISKLVHPVGPLIIYTKNIAHQTGFDEEQLNQDINEDAPTYE